MENIYNFKALFAKRFSMAACEIQTEALKTFPSYYRQIVS